MQIMPDNDETLNISDPFNPQQNIMGGTKYFKRMLNRYQNNLFLALAAYNAGPVAVDKYQEVPPYNLHSACLFNCLIFLMKILITFYYEKIKFNKIQTLIFFTCGM